MIIFIAFLAISTPSVECLCTRTVQGNLFIGFFHLQLFEESTMVIFIVSNMKKLRLGELKNWPETTQIWTQLNWPPAWCFRAMTYFTALWGKRTIGSTLRRLCHLPSLLVRDHPLARPLSSSALLPIHHRWNWHLWLQVNLYVSVYLYSGICLQLNNN